MTVIYIRAAKSKGYLRIGVESDKKYDFTVSETEYSSLGAPLIGDNLTRESFNGLYQADMRYKARLKAFRVLSFADNSELMLKRKLLEAGVSREVAEETVREMVSLGYINAERQIKNLVLNEIRLHHSGPIKIIHKLVLKGYVKNQIEEVIDGMISLGEIDFEAEKEELIKAKLPSDADECEIKKLLYKSGYHVC
jgi:SOS response regulatory protein OraA/RecX